MLHVIPGLIYIIGVLLVPVFAFAEDSFQVAEAVDRNNALDEVVAVVSSLPSPSQVPLEISANNVEQFCTLLPDAVCQLVRSNRFAMLAKSRLPFFWQMSEAWRDSSNNNLGLFKLDSEGQAVYRGVEDRAQLVGAPFGTASALERESSSLRKFRKIFLNSSFVAFAASDAMLATDWYFFSSNQVLRQASGHYFVLRNRNFGASASEADAATELSGGRAWEFVQLFDFSFPEVLKNYSLYRVSGADKSRRSFKIHSPVAGDTRTVSEASEWEPLLGGDIGVRDFIIDNYEPGVAGRVVEEKELLVPFMQNDLQRIRTVEGGEKVFSESDSSSFWNFEMRGYGSTLPYLPNSVVYVPRNVWVIEYPVNNIFSSVGRVRIVIDKGTLLPVYKTEFMQNGGVKRLLIAGWRLTEDDKNEERYPIPGFVLSFSMSGDSATAVRFPYAELSRDLKFPQEMKEIFK
ncbi:MAG: hypothetical protein PHC51_12590 [bacterium]|nr:hypothetical protein [bacterium]